MRIFFLLTLILQTACMTPSSEKPVRPNILVIMADDLTHSDIGCYGGKNIRTPHIDAIAQQGLRFSRAFQAAPMCSPTRHNLYTGLYPVRSGAYPNHAFAKKGTKSIAHYLQDSGYRVGLTGKTHIAPEASFPFDYMTKTRDPDPEALENFMLKDKTQPFCAFVCFHEPHTPWDKGDPSGIDPDQLVLPPFLVDTDETRKRLTEYYAEIEYMDQSVGKVTALLERHHLAENTLLIFTSEQGNPLPFAKWTCYDQGLQTAFIARWPGHIAEGSTSDAMIEYVDVVPTLLEIAGTDQVDSLDGESFLPVLEGKKQSHKDYVFGIQTTRGISNGSEHYGIRSVRSEQYKYILNLTPEATFQNNLTEGKGDWTSFWPTWLSRAETDSSAQNLVYRFQHRPGVELYDIVNDPYEMNNLAHLPEYDSVMRQLRAELDSWMEAQGDQGQATEMEALMHQKAYLNQKK